MKDLRYSSIFLLILMNPNICVLINQNKIHPCLSFLFQTLAVCEVFYLINLTNTIPCLNRFLSQSHYFVSQRSTFSVYNVYILWSILHDTSCSPRSYVQCVQWSFLNIGFVRRYLYSLPSMYCFTYLKSFYLYMHFDCNLYKKKYYKCIKNCY